MSSYFLLHTGLCRDIEDGASKKKKCTWKQEHFYLEAGKLASISEYEDGLIYRSAAGPFTVPVGAQLSTAEVYEAALARWQVIEDARLAKETQEKEMKKLLKKGMTVHAHASAEAGAAESVPTLSASVTVKERPHFLADITVLDFEATGNDPLELAAVRYQNFEPVAELQSFIRFMGPVPSFITGLTGITSADVRYAPDAREVLSQFKALAGDSLLVAHNAQYDLRILETTRTKLGAATKLPNDFLCTLQVAKDRYEGPHKLGELCQRFGIANAGAHRAMNDVRMCFNLLRHMHEDYDVAASLMNVANLTKAKRKPAQPTLFAA